MVHPQPEDAGQPEAEPARKRRGDEAQEVVEHGDGLGHDHADGPGGEGDEEPGGGRHLGPPDGVLGVAQDAVEDVLRRDAGVNDGGDGDRGDGDALDRLEDCGAPGRGEGGRGDVGPDADVDDDGGDYVDGGVCDLQECQRLWPVVGALELGDGAEEDGMAGCRTKQIRFYSFGFDTIVGIA